VSLSIQNLSAYRMSSSFARRLVSCGNCHSKYPNNQLMNVLLKHKYPDAHLSLSQSLVDGFSAYPLKQMKSEAYKIFSPVGKIAEILSNSGVPCPKCNKVHWK